MDRLAWVTCLEADGPTGKVIPPGRFISVLLFLMIGVHAAHGQEQVPVRSDSPSLAPLQRTWAIEASLLSFLYPDTITLWNPSATARHGYWHFEARYQWEDWRTASLWVGHRFAFGEKLKVELTPMAGAVFGLINGAAPGYLLQARWRALSFYSSSEVFFDLDRGSGNFGYTWNELGVDLRVVSAGIVAQRLRTVQSPLDLQRGVWLMREQGGFTFGAYLFNFGRADLTGAISLAYGFGAGPLQRPMNSAKPAMGTREKAADATV